MDLRFPGGRIGQTKVLCPDGNDVIGRFAETATAHERGGSHRDGAIGGFHGLIAHAAFLLGFA